MSTLSPAPEGSTEPVVSPVTTQTDTAEQTSPQADKPAGTEQEATASEPAEKPEPSQDDEAKKTWKEKRKERNRERWQEFKAAKDYTINSLQKEIDRLKSRQAPDLTNVVDPDEVLAKKTAWTIQQSTVEEKEQALKQESEALAAAQQQALNESLADMMDDARERFPDFDQVFTQNVPIHNRALFDLADSEKGADIAYYLGKHPKEAKALFDLYETAPRKALKEMGAIEARLSAPKAKTVSTAPKPAPILSGGANPIAFDMARASVADVAAQLKKAGHIR